MRFPPISMKASVVFYIAIVVTLIMSCMRGELFWVGLITAIVMVVVSFLEGLLIYAPEVGSRIQDYMRAKSVHNVEEIKQCKENLKNEAENGCEFSFMCLLVCLVMAPLTLMTAGAEVIDALKAKFFRLGKISR